MGFMNPAGATTPARGIPRGPASDRHLTHNPGTVPEWPMASLSSERPLTHNPGTAFERSLTQLDSF
eukprot:7409149-Pyramimonas_sp.AAC.1